MKARPTATMTTGGTMSTHAVTIDSPVGALELRADDDALVTIAFTTAQPDADGVAANRQAELDVNPVLAKTIEQLREYFAGERTTFDLPLRTGGTPFQRKVWEALAEIPYGETWTYAELARRIGSPTAVRAVGAANGQNPLPIVLPCHRVIGSNGKLVGYGGGMDRKRFLLELEARTRMQLDFAASGASLHDTTSYEPA